MNIIGYDQVKGDHFISRQGPTGEMLEGTFSVASHTDIERAVEKAKMVSKDFARLSGHKRATFLEEIAHQIEALGDQLPEMASKESGLPIGRFQGERGRTCGQLRMFANVARKGSWTEATIDTALPDRKPLPRADIRSMLTGIGPVVVFTASNFPLAFSTAGGDTASALAAGCPVIVKAHESHLGTNQLVAEAIQKAAQKTGMPDGVFSSLVGEGYELGKQLVQHPDVKGVAFTGSQRGGLALQQLTTERKDPIPFFAEMGSVNPVVLCDFALAQRAEAIANMYAGSITLGVGQFCTNPGLLFAVKSPHLEKFKLSLSSAMDDIDRAIMLNQGISNNYTKLRNEVISTEHVTKHTSAEGEGGVPTLVSTTGAHFLSNQNLQHEIFGPLSLVVECADSDELTACIQSLEGQLTGTLMVNDKDVDRHAGLIELLQTKVGRLIFNQAPTGVEVGNAMHHGGPFPATNDARFTSVGAKAIKRFARPICFQNAPERILPNELRNGTEGMMRQVNGEFRNGAIV